MSDIFQEAEEELKAQKNAVMIRRVAYLFVSVALVVILSTALYSWNKSRVQQNNIKFANEFFSVVESDQGQVLTADQQQKLIEISSNSTGYASLSSLMLAKQYFRDKNFDKYESTLNELIANKDHDLIFRHYALCNLVTYYIDIDVKKAILLLSDLDIDSSPYKHLFIFSKALIAHKEGNIDDAKKNLNLVILDATTPPKITENAKAVMYLIEKVKTK
jgi:hypothetical protein